MAGILLALEASWHGWNLYFGTWDPQKNLPLHGMIIIAMVYMTTIEGLRPTWSSVWKTALIGNLSLLLYPPFALADRRSRQGESAAAPP